MASFNRVILLGNLTRDPELRFTPSGLAVCKIGLAVNNKFKNKAGELCEDVLFVDVDIFGKTAENTNQFMRKGGSIMLEGRLKMDTWEDKKTGDKRSKTGVIAETVQFLGGRREEDSAPKVPVERTSKIDPQDVPGFDKEPDDVPF